MSGSHDLPFSAAAAIKPERFDDDDDRHPHDASSASSIMVRGDLLTPLSPQNHTTISASSSSSAASSSAFDLALQPFFNLHDGLPVKRELQPTLHLSNDNGLSAFDDSKRSEPLAVAVDNGWPKPQVPVIGQLQATVSNDDDNDPTPFGSAADSTDQPPISTPSGSSSSSGSGLDDTDADETTSIQPPTPEIEPADRPTYRRGNYKKSAAASSSASPSSSSSSSSSSKRAGSGIKTVVTYGLTPSHKAGRAKKEQTYRAIILEWTQKRQQLWNQFLHDAIQYPELPHDTLSRFLPCPVAPAGKSQPYTAEQHMHYFSSLRQAILSDQADLDRHYETIVLAAAKKHGQLYSNNRRRTSTTTKTSKTKAVNGTDDRPRKKTKRSSITTSTTTFQADFIAVDKPTFFPVVMRASAAPPAPDRSSMPPPRLPTTTNNIIRPPPESRSGCPPPTVIPIPATTASQQRIVTDDRPPSSIGLPRSFQPPPPPLKPTNQANPNRNAAPSFRQFRPTGPPPSTYRWPPPMTVPMPVSMTVPMPVSMPYRSGWFAGPPPIVRG